jgi:hypothetical protein
MSGRCGCRGGGKRGGGSGRSALVLTDKGEDARKLKEVQAVAMFDKESEARTVLDQESDATRAAKAEIALWKNLPLDLIANIKKKEKNINHFKLFTQLKHQFPLLYAAFRQFATALPHEGNVERVNSAAKAAADPNMDPRTLSRRVYIEKNQEIYPICINKVRRKYIEKYGANLSVCICLCLLLLSVCTHDLI